MNRLVAEGLEDSLRVGAIGLVARDVGADRVRRQQDHPVALVLELASPVVGHTARLHDDGRRRPRGEELGEPRSGQAVRLGDFPGMQRHRNFEH